MKNITLHSFNTDIFTEETKKEIKEIWKKYPEDKIRFRGSKEKDFIEFLRVEYGKKVEKDEEEDKEYWVLMREGMGKIYNFLLFLRCAL